MRRGGLRPQVAVAAKVLHVLLAALRRAGERAGREGAAAWTHVRCLGPVSHPCAAGAARHLPPPRRSDRHSSLVMHRPLPGAPLAHLDGALHHGEVVGLQALQVHQRHDRHVLVAPKHLGGLR